MGLAAQVSVTPLVFALAWSLVSRAYNLPSVAELAGAIAEMVRSGTYLHDILVSSIRGLAGFFVGFGLGSLTGMLTGRYVRFFLAVGGLLLFLRWTPVLALLPITVRVAGIGEGPKIFLIAWACYFISWTYTHVAVAGLNPAYVWWSDSLGLSVIARFWKVYAPAVAPTLVGGARVALAVAMIVVVAAEFSGTFQEGFFRDGLGYRISRAVETNRNDINVSCIITLGLLGIALDFLLVQFVKRGLRRLTGIDFYRVEG
ncbi:MAG: ABC transporter permease subunit [Planctomycetaceae bacterium]|nr:ABC transporter permease subunit [Planctomycetaceae bacterium]